MIKSALGAVCSLLFVLFTAPSAHAAGTSATKAAPQKSVSAQKRKTPPKKRTSSSLAAREKAVKRASVVRSKRKAGYQRAAFTPAAPAVPPVISAGDLAGLNTTRDPLALKSNVAFVLDPSNAQVLFEKNSNAVLPIASLTKLMTALVVVEAHQDMDEVLEVTTDDIDREKNTSSRLRIGAKLTRANMLHIALMSSENRAASALGRNYPGGLRAFVAAMNAKASALGMTDTHYVEPTGLSSRNIASARDLAKLVVAAYEYPVLRQYSTDPKYVVDTGGHLLQYANSNHLVKNPSWEIGLQKTGYISEAGNCLVMLTSIEGRPIVMVFLDSKGKQSRLADAGRVRKWLEEIKLQKLTNAMTSKQS